MRLPVIGLRAAVAMLVAAVTLPFYGLILWTIVTQRRIALADVETDLLRIARAGARDELHIIREANEMLILLSREEGMRSRTDASCGAWLAELLEFNPQYANLGIADPDGLVLCSAVPITSPVNIADRIWFQRAVQRRAFAMGHADIGRLTGSPLIAFGYPVLDASGAVRQVFFAGVHLAAFHQAVSDIHLLAGGTFLFLDEQGLILSQYPAAELRHDTSITGTPLAQCVLSRSQEEVCEVAGLDGATVLAAVVPMRTGMEGPNLFVAVTVPKTVVLADSERIHRRALLLLLLGGVVSVTIGWSLADRTILAPGRTLITMVQQWGRGDLMMRNRLTRGPRELRQLGAVLDAMAAALEQRAQELTRLNAALEQRVAERTSQVTAANLELSRRGKVMQSLLEDLHASKERLERQQAALRAANAQLEQMASMKDEFLANVSHELRTPLTAIKEGISLVVDGALGATTAEQQEFLKIVDNNIDRLTELISDLLDLSKMESARFRLMRRRMNVVQLIQPLLNSYRGVAGRRVLTVELQEAPEVFADANRILQVLGNLLSNAVKFTREDGHITVRIEPRHDEVAVSVADDGVGIPPHQLTKLFKKFSQLAAGEGKTRGTGLGLAICKQLVERHHGTIRVTSESDRGATFTFTLPVYTPVFALEESFQEILDVARRTKRDDAVAVLALDARAIAKEMREVVEAVRRQVSQDDVVLPMEPHWLVVLAAADRAETEVIAQRLRAMIHQLAPEQSQMTVAVGVAVYPADGDDVRALFAKATGMSAAPDKEVLRGETTHSAG